MELCPKIGIFGEYNVLFGINFYVFSIAGGHDIGATTRAHGFNLIPYIVIVGLVEALTANHGRHLGFW